MYLNLIAQDHSESMHFVASSYNRTRNHRSASDALLPCNHATGQQGLTDLDFAFHVATPYKKYKNNKSCHSR
jgi:hypothetical protein